jgi:hypothetical protein
VSFLTKKRKLKILQINLIVVPYNWHEKLWITRRCTGIFVVSDMQFTGLKSFPSNERPTYDKTG